MALRLRKGKQPEPVSPPPAELDLNKDGQLNQDDRNLAKKVLAEKSNGPVEQSVVQKKAEPVFKGRIALVEKSAAFTC